jgi:hypothetical protein
VSELPPRRFDTFEEARDAFNRALPDFRCLVCHHDHVAILGEFEDGLRTKLTLQRDDDPVARSFVPTLVVICQNCGHISSFAEDGIRSLAQGRSGAG